MRPPASACSGETLLQHQHRVVRRLPPQRVVELAEDLARLRVPGPPEIGGEFGRRSSRSGIVGVVKPLSPCLRSRVTDSFSPLGHDSSHGLHYTWSTARNARDRCCRPRRRRRPFGGRARPSRPKRRGDGAGGGAFGDHVDALRDQLHRARRVVERDDDRVVHATSRAAATSSASTDLPPAPSTNDGCHASKRLALPGPERRRKRRRGFRFGGVDPRLRPRATCRDADAGEQPAAAERRDDGVDVRQILEDLEPGRAVAADEVVVVERMDEVAGHPIASRAPRPCASTRRSDALTIVAPSRSMARSLVSGAVSMTMTLQRAPAAPRGERDALRGVAGADRPDAAGELSAGGSRRRRSARRGS